MGLGISRRDSWLVSEDMSANISLELAVTNGFSYLQCVDLSHARGAAISLGVSRAKIQSELTLRGIRKSTKPKKKKRWIKTERLTCAGFVKMLYRFPRGRLVAVHHVTYF
jgi:hypothetical protein